MMETNCLLIGVRVCLHFVKSNQASVMTFSMIRNSPGSLSIVTVFIFFSLCWLSGEVTNIAIVCLFIFNALVGGAKISQPSVYFGSIAALGVIAFTISLLFESVRGSAIVMVPLLFMIILLYCVIGYFSGYFIMLIWARIKRQVKV
jgi:hypothetical protein